MKLDLPTHAQLVAFGHFLIYCLIMTSTTNLIPAAEVVALVGWKHRSSLTRAVQAGALTPALKGNGPTGEEFFDRRTVLRFIAKRNAKHEAA